MNKYGLLALITLIFLSCSTFEDIQNRLPVTSSSSSSSAPNRIDFTTELSSPGIYFVVIGGATVTWHYSDGTTEIGDSPNSNFGSAAHREHYVTVDPPEALIKIFINYSSSGVSSLSGLSNFANLCCIYAISNSSLTNLSLAGCHSLNQIYLNATGATATTVDQWLIELDQATGNGNYSHIIADFYYPVRTTASAQAYTNLVLKSWIMHDSGY